MRRQRSTVLKLELRTARPAWGSFNITARLLAWSFTDDWAELSAELEQVTGSHY